MHGSGFFISAMPRSTPTSGSATEAASRNPRPTCGRRAAPPGPCLQGQDVLLRLLPALHRPEHHHQLEHSLSERENDRRRLFRISGTALSPDHQASDSQQPAAAGLVDPVAQKIAAELIPTVARLGDRLVGLHDSSREPGIPRQGRPQPQRGAAPELQLFSARVATPWSYRAARPGIPNMRWAPTRWRRIQFPGRHTWTMNSRPLWNPVLLRAVQLQFDSRSEHDGPRPQRLRCELARAHPRRDQDAARASDHRRPQSGSGRRRQSTNKEVFAGR